VAYGKSLGELLYLPSCLVLMYTKWIYIDLILSICLSVCFNLRTAGWEFGMIMDLKKITYKFCMKYYICASTKRGDSARL
jgi:hypothetical protein